MMNPKPATYEDGFRHGRLVGNAETCLAMFRRYCADQTDTIDTLKQTLEEVLDVIGGEYADGVLKISSQRYGFFKLPSDPLVIIEFEEKKNG